MFLVITALATSIELDLLNVFYQAAEPLHGLCRMLAPESPYQEAYSALVCGSSLSQSELQKALQATSLLHLAIVSGSHLILLENILERFLRSWKMRHQIILSVLFIYSLLTGWQPPAVRAVIGRALAHFDTRFRMNFSSLQMTWYAGWLTWALFPEWGMSFSLLLSWGASLGLAMTSAEGSLSFKQEWKTHSIVYLAILPILIPMSPPHPLSILCNWIIGPILGVLLFPLSLICFLVPALTPLIDFVWIASEWIIKFCSQWTPIIESSVRTPILSLWVYLIFIHGASLVIERLQRRPSS